MGLVTVLVRFDYNGLQGFKVMIFVVTRTRSWSYDFVATYEDAEGHEDMSASMPGTMWQPRLIESSDSTCLVYLLCDDACGKRAPLAAAATS